NLVFIVPPPTNPQLNAIQVIDPQNNNAVSPIPIPGLVVNSGGVINKHITVNNSNGRVYVRGLDLDPTHTGNIFVVDGNRASATFKSGLATVPMYIDQGADDLVVDEGLNAVVATAGSGLRIVVIDAANQATRLAVGSVVADAAIDPVAHRAFAVAAAGTAIQTVALAPSPTLTTTAIGAETGAVVVDPTVHKAYASYANGTAAIQ